MQSKDDKGRNGMLLKNILFSGVLRVMGLFCSLAIVPLTIDYLDEAVYGVWLTITNVLYWFSFFDVGLGNGMRNYLAASISAGDYEKGRAYLTSTFAMLTLISLALAVIVVPFILLVDVGALLNTTVVSSGELRNALLVAVVFTLVSFVVKNVGYVFVALQKYAMNDLLVVGGNVLALVAIFALTHTATHGALIYVVAAFVIMPVVVFVLAAIPIFRKYPQLRPTRQAFDYSLVRPIVTKGVGFFVIQLTSCLVIFGSSNVIIMRLVGETAVTQYGIAYKYFHLIAMAYIIVLAPMWNAYTDAYVKGNYEWIQKTFRRALMVWLLTFVGGAVMLAGSHIFYGLWIRDRVDIPFAVSAAVFAYISMYNLNNCVTYLLNGLNKIRVQVITSVVFTLLYLVAAHYFGLQFGVVGIVLSMAGAYAAMALIHLYQCGLIIHQRARGVWDK